MHVGMCMCSQRTTLGTWFSPFILRSVPDTNCHYPLSYLSSSDMSSSRTLAWHLTICLTWISPLPYNFRWKCAFQNMYFTIFSALHWSVINSYHWDAQQLKHPSITHFIKPSEFPQRPLFMTPTTPNIYITLFQNTDIIFLHKFVDCELFIVSITKFPKD